MSVLIKGFELPKKGDTLHFAVTFGYDKMAIIDTTGENDPILFDVVEVPTPHGRLKDVDALKPYLLNEHYKHRLVIDTDEVANAPTVIEAEGRE